MLGYEVLYVACNSQGERIVGQIQKDLPKDWPPLTHGELVDIHPQFGRVVPVTEIIRRQFNTPPRIEYLFPLDSTEIDYLAGRGKWSSVEVLDKREP